MNGRKYSKYNVIMNVCIAMAVISALFFDHMGSYSWIAGTAGLLSGIIAAVTYFRD